MSDPQEMDNKCLGMMVLRTLDWAEEDEGKKQQEREGRRRD